MCCAHIMGERGYSVRGLFVNYGQAAAQEEEKAAKAIANELQIPLKILSFATSKEMCFGAGEIEGRNLFLVSSAITYSALKSGLIVLGIHAGTPYFDCTSMFADQLSSLIENMSDGRISLSTPLVELDKLEIYDYVKTEGLRIESAYSCEAGVVNGCGDCLSCRDRMELKS